VNERTLPLALYEGSLLVLYVSGRAVGWWDAAILPALGFAGMVTVCALPMLLLWVASRRAPDDRAPAVRAGVLALGAALVAAAVAVWHLDRLSGDTRLLVAAGVSAPLLAAVLLALGRRPGTLRTAGYLAGCYAVPAALLAAVASALA
jgi:hypothetical protein